MEEERGNERSGSKNPEDEGCLSLKGKTSQETEVACLSQCNKQCDCLARIIQASALLSLSPSPPSFIHTRKRSHTHSLFLSSSLLSPLRLQLTLSSQAALLNPTLKPYPIYNAVCPVSGPDSYEWIEMTPHEVCALESDAAIPIWALGRQFEKGRCQTRAPEQTIGLLMGMMGSGKSTCLVLVQLMVLHARVFRMLL